MPASRPVLDLFENQPSLSVDVDDLGKLTCGRNVHRRCLLVDRVVFLGISVNYNKVQVRNACQLTAVSARQPATVVPRKLVRVEFFKTTATVRPTVAQHASVACQPLINCLIGAVYGRRSVLYGRKCEINSVLDIPEKEIRVTDTRGREVHYITAPGEFVIHFGKINVKRNLQHLAGEISINLQVPIGGGGPFGIKWDIPYSAVPQKKLIGGYTCDAQSGYVKDGDRNSTAKVERDLSSGHKFLPELGGSEQMFSTMCAEISPRTYTLTRTVRLPSKEELQEMVNQKFNGMDSGLKSKFKIGKGKFQVYLNLKSSPNSPQDSDSFYSSIKGCQCCARGGGGLFCRGCKEKCKSQYAEQCLAPGTQTVACYTVDYSFRASENYGDVQKFLRDNNFVDNGPSAPMGGGVGGGSGGSQHACINAINSPTYQRYCKTHNCKLSTYFNDRYDSPHNRYPKGTLSGGQIPPAVEKLNDSSPTKDESPPQSVVCTGKSVEQQVEQKTLTTTNSTDVKSQEDSTLMVSFEHPN
ncbi:hypothetical protein Tsp_03750 [Trichinella spiralis]|uniref:hypothetical protein n=1 Tax=Trichinella spiralis TaxID=6334 RepID=UPI0001EFBCFD|nr:hypothetical protein Tsp_03750 [Trichinella spiralis]